jgi:hypothetical protein
MRGRRNKVATQVALLVPTTVTCYLLCVTKWATNVDSEAMQPSTNSFNYTEKMPLFLYHAQVGFFDKSEQTVGNNDKSRSLTMVRFSQFYICTQHIYADTYYATEHTTGMNCTNTLQMIPNMHMNVMIHSL